MLENILKTTEISTFPQPSIINKIIKKKKKKRVIGGRIDEIHD